MSVQPNPNEPGFLTPEEYLERERKTEFRSEYRGNGVVVAMAGASRAHNLLTGNLFALLWYQLRGKSCSTYNNNMKVRLPGTLSYAYPDIVAVCGEQEFQDEREDILTNPTLIVETLSDSTAVYDRGEKWERYQQIPSLREYVLVSQSRAVVERFTRQGDLWVYSLTAGVDSAVTLESVGVSLKLAEIYEGVSLSAA
jgi:Uma2 family endonuclease